MSEQNVQIVRDGIERINSGQIERILELVHPDFEVVVPAELSAEPDVYRGHEGMRRYFESFEEIMDEIHFVAERFWDAGEGAVVVLTRLTAKGGQTAIPVEQQVAQVWTLRDGKAIRIRAYASLREALKSVGLSERARSVPAPNGAARVRRPPRPHGSPT
jgi:ketosteroid isomerase-like protein